MDNENFAANLMIFILGLVCVFIAFFLLIGTRFITFEFREFLAIPFMLIAMYIFWDFGVSGLSNRRERDERRQTEFKTNLRGRLNGARRRSR